MAVAAAVAAQVAAAAAAAAAAAQPHQGASTAWVATSAAPVPATPAPVACAWASAGGGGSACPTKEPLLGPPGRPRGGNSGRGPLGPLPPQALTRGRGVRASPEHWAQWGVQVRWARDAEAARARWARTMGSLNVHVRCALTLADRTTPRPSGHARVRRRSADVELRVAAKCWAKCPGAGPGAAGVLPKASSSALSSPAPPPPPPPLEGPEVHESEEAARRHPRRDKDGPAGRCRSWTRTCGGVHALTQRPRSSAQSRRSKRQLRPPSAPERRRPPAVCSSTSAAATAAAASAH